MMPRIYAVTTTVSIAKTRGAITKLLREWGCTQLGWGDDFEARQVTLRFVWSHEGREFTARIVVPLPTEREVWDEFTRRPTAKQLAQRLAQRDRSVHRILLLKLTADLQSVQAGILQDYEVFLPMLEGDGGRTLSEVMGQRIADGARLLEDGGDDGR